MTHAIRERGSAFRSKKTIAGAVAAGVGAAALALGAPLAAHAATQITSGHVDIVSVDSSGTPGTITGSGFSAWPVDYEFVYNTNTATGISCENDVYTVVEHPSGAPALGLANQSTGSYNVTLLDASGGSNPGDVRFVEGGSNVVLDSGDPTVSTALPVHEHYELEFEGSCDAESLSYDVVFSLGGDASATQAFTLTINN